jgi:hypothetical protein
MAYLEILDQIYNTVKSVDGIGVVHKYSRWTNREDVFKTLYGVPLSSGKKEYKINGWEISRKSVREELRGSFIVFRRHVFVIRGFYGLEDDMATEIEFNLLLERICDALRKLLETNWTEDPATPWFYNEPPSITDISVVMFSNFLVHAAEIQFPAIERR